MKMFGSVLPVWARLAQHSSVGGLPIQFSRALYFTPMTKMFGSILPVWARSVRHSNVGGLPIQFSRVLHSIPVTVARLRRAFNRDTSIGLIIGSLMSLLAAYVGAAYANVQLEEKKRSIVDPVNVLTEMFERSIIEADVKHFIPVPSLKTCMRDMEALVNRQATHTYVIFGPRGVGKTTSICKALEGVPGVIHLALAPCTVSNFYASILETFQYEHHDMNNVALVRAALKLFKKKTRKVPTFVVSVNHKADFKNLMNLLIEMKTIGSDYKLANFVVDVSSSRAALLIPIDIFELRVHPEVVNDTSMEVIQAYLNKRLLQIYPQANDLDRKELIEYHIQSLGTRFLDAVQLIEFMQECDDFEQDTSFAKGYISMKKEKYRMAFQTFVEMFDGISDKEKKRLWKRLLEGELPLKEVYQLLKMTRVQFIERMTEFNPHPVFIDPLSELISVGNFTAEEEFKKLL